MVSGRKMSGKGELKEKLSPEAAEAADDSKGKRRWKSSVMKRKKVEKLIMLTSS